MALVTMSAILPLFGKAPKQAPNILFFLVDDMGWQDTSEPFFYDADGKEVVTELNRRYRTPNMETLADKGMKFTNAYAMTVCTPTRVSLMTGMNSARHHVTQYVSPEGRDVGGKGSPKWRLHGINEKDITLPRLLSKAGYRTIHAGKGHFGSINTYGADPENLGFDVNIAGCENGLPGSYTGNYGKGGKRAVPGLEAYHGTDTFLTEALTLEMNKAIEKSVQDGVPFFAYMSHYAVHGPLNLDKRFVKHYPQLKGGDLKFATMIEGMDKSLGDIVKKINDLGVGENTLVIFMSDNGSAKNKHSPPLRSKKGSCYEGGSRVPMLVAWAKPDPGKGHQLALPIKEGSREDDLVLVYDWFPTLLGMAGVTCDHDVDGYDLRPYFAGKDGQHRPQQVVMHFPHRHQSDHFSFYRDGDWKLIVHYMTGKKELYHLANDLGETKNLAATQPERVASMSKALAKELNRMGAQYPIDVKTSKELKP